MARCQLIDACLFFRNKIADMPEAADKLKSYYCRNDFMKCARYVYYRMTGESPTDLLPNDLQTVSDHFGWGLKQKK